jgi:hypothetical protein
MALCQGNAGWPPALEITLKLSKKDVDLKQRLLLSSILVLLTMTLIRCSEDPNPVGAGLLPASDFLRLDTVSVAATVSYSQASIPLGTSSRLLIGNTPEIESWAVLRFGPIPDSILFLPMVSAEVNLRAVYHFGDSLAPFSVDVHQVLQNWGTDSLTIDSIKAPGFYNASSLTQASFSSVGDTATISVPVDTTIVRSWGTASDTALTNFGLLLRPTNANVIKGFAPFTASDQTLLPRLLMRFQDGAGNIDTAIVKTGTYRYVARLGNTSWASDSLRIHVRNGIAFRGFVAFDVTSIPLHAAIHKATLQLTLDPTQSEFNSFTVDSTLSIFIASDGTVVNSINEIGEPQQLGDRRIYESPVGQIVQRWVRGASLQKIALAGYGESNAVDLFVFYGAAASPALKPKLTIIYSLIQ